MDLRILGPLEVVGPEGEALKLPGARPRGLLALLALRAPNVVPTDTIIETLWGDKEIAGPEAALHTTVNRLRDAVGEELIVTEPGGYRLEIPSVNTDLNRFRVHLRRARQLHTLGHAGQACESYRHALAQWRGPALSDLREFEFTETMARQVEEERLQAVESLMEATLADGGHDLVAGELFGLVESFPFRERLWELLMLALYRSGRQTEALAAFKDLRTRLGEELGIEPWPELVDLEERILLHDPSLSEFEPAPAPLGDDVQFLSFAPGEVIVEQGTKAEAIYWIEEGLVEVMKIGADGDELRVAELGAGRYFGELASILGTTRSATVRALAPTTVSVYDTDSFRTRIALDEGESGKGVDISGDLRDLINRGHYLQAYDLAASEIERGRAAPETRWLAVLALARSGATSQARRRYTQFGLDSLDPATLTPRLAEDIQVLSARLDKDEALAQPDRRQEWAERSARGYESAFDATDSPYHAVNAATMWLLAGDAGRAAKLADAVLSGGSLQGHGYWDASTEAEAALIAGDIDRARTALATAGEAGEGLFSQRATTLKQLKLVCSLKHIDPDVLEPIRNPTVAHFCGHRILPEGQKGRFPAAEEDRVRAELDEALEELGVGIGFGSLAAGADILAAEALLDRGAELNVVLPFPQEEFVRTSVASAGSGWVDRFEHCLAQAETVELATTGEYLDDPVLFDFCARIAMGDALIRANFLQADAHQIAVWDGTGATAAAGTAVDVSRWSRTGAASTVIAVPAGNSEGGPTPQIPHQRQVRAIVFADFAGFSKLSDAQLVSFQEVVMQRVADHLAPFRSQLLSGRTWGDGISLVFEDVAAAAECALDLVQAGTSIEMEKAGLPQLRGLRVAAHAAPVFEGWDPIAETDLFFGVGLTQAARIEPRTPEGEIYTTHAFAALAMLSEVDSFECQYVGNMPTAKQFGDMPLYALRRRAAAVSEL